MTFVRILFVILILAILGGLWHIASTMSGLSVEQVQADAQTAVAGASDAFSVPQWFVWLVVIAIIAFILWLIFH